MNIDTQAQPDLQAIDAAFAGPLQDSYDFIVCGAGSAGCVVAARLAEDGDARVLLLEAGGHDAHERIADPARWPTNLGSTHDWAFVGEPTAALNGRRLPLSMGKGLGGGSSINVMVWARGHQSDWDFYAAESGDAGWGYQSILSYYRRIEDWQGAPDSVRRGIGGPAYVAPAASPQTLAHATVEAAGAMGIPRYDSPNGEMMERPGGAAFADLRIRDGKRESVYRSYVHPMLQRPNLTVVTDALVERLVLDGKKVVGVALAVRGQRRTVHARREVVLSMGAVNTPKVLMQSGIGPADLLRQHGIAVHAHLPGVGENHQDHIAFGCTWEYKTPQPVGAGGCESTVYWKSDARMSEPDVLLCQLEFAVPSPPETGVVAPEHGWTMFAGLGRPKSRGTVRISGPNPGDPVLIDPNALSDPRDLDAAVATLELTREIGNHPALSGLVKREVAPRYRHRADMVQFLKNAAITYWHQAGTAKMGRDEMSVVDAQLRVYGIENLRVADASIMPRITAGNTMAPCVVIGERAADFIKAAHGMRATPTPIA